MPFAFLVQFPGHAEANLVVSCADADVFCKTSQHVGAGGSRNGYGPDAPVFKCLFIIILETPAHSHSVFSKGVADLYLKFRRGYPQVSGVAICVWPYHLVHGPFNALQ